MRPHHFGWVSILIVALTFSPGCARRTPVVLLEGERQSMTEEQVKAMRRRGREVPSSLWFDGAELDWIARDYARRQKIDFNFSRVETQIWVPRSRDYLARVDYSSGMGQPVLSVTIGWDGSVVDHFKGVAIDTVEGSPQAGHPPDEK
jgi:hypothetical protein